MAQSTAGNLTVTFVCYHLNLSFDVINVLELLLFNFLAKKSHFKSKQVLSDIQCTPIEDQFWNCLKSILAIISGMANPVGQGQIMPNTFADLAPSLNL